MRKLVAPVTITVTLLLLGACKSTSPEDASDDGAAATTEAGDPDGDQSAGTTPIEDDRAPGVTEDSVRIGITYVDFEAMGDQVSIDHGDYEAAYGPIVDDINENGGIHGRTIEPVFAPVDPSSAVSTDEVCTRLTQDEEVFAAVGSFYAEAVNCFISTNETAVIGGEMTAERLDNANAPWFTLDPSSDTQVDAVARLAEAGELDGTLGVVLADADQPLYESRITPVIDDAGIEPAETYVFDSGAEPEQQQASTDAALEQFEAADIETILAIGAGGPPVTAGGLGRSDYRPRLLITNLNGVLSFLRDDSQDHTVLDGSVAVGPYDQDAMLDLGGPTGECFDLQRAAGLTLTPPSQVEEGEPNQFVSSNIACQQFGLLEAILQEAGEELDYGTFRTAGYNLGEIELPSSPEPFTFGPPPQADGDLPLFLYRYQPESSEFEMVGDATS